MCGRFTYLYTWKQLHRLLSLSRVPGVELSPRYNVAPTQLAPAVRLGADGLREGVLLQWGLVPSWAKEPSIGNSLINARGETVRTKPAFRAAFAARRCVIPISGFYEWRKAPPPPPGPPRDPAQGAAGEKRNAGGKQPFWIGRTNRQPLYLAGLWERWAKGDEPRETFTIITTSASALVARLHDRMPVILREESIERWLDPRTDAAAAEAMLQPASEVELQIYAVSRRVNSPRNDDAGVLEPTAEDAGSIDAGPRPAREERQAGLWSGDQP